MLKNYFKKFGILLALPAWVYLSFFVSQYIIIGIIWLLSLFNISLSLISDTVIQTVLSAVVYVLTLIILICVPMLIKKWRTSKKDIGLTRLPTWTDILITPAGLIIYFIFSSILIIIVKKLVPSFNINQPQDVGFDQLNSQFEYYLAFASFVIIAPIAEEILFRGYLFGKIISNKFPVWVAVIITSLLFGLVHGNFNVMVDTFALSIILCLLRLITGSIWPSILLHMIKNGIAFYILFINPTILTTLVR